MDAVPILVSLGLLILGFLLLIKGADFLIAGAAAVAVRFHISEMMVGLTIVAMGTSAPELVVSVFASWHGNTDIAFGNVIGSNIANILLILGISGLFQTLRLEKNTVWREIPYSLLAVGVLLVLCNDRWFGLSTNLLTRGDGLILLLFFVIFIVYTFGIPRVSSSDSPEVKPLSPGAALIRLVAGMAGLYLGGHLTVIQAAELGGLLGLSEAFVGLTLVAVGTSMPELFTSVIAARRGKSDMAIGNVVGSNIFNLLMILGLASLVRPLPFAGLMNLDLLVLMGVSLVLFLIMFTGPLRILNRPKALAFLVIYALYLGFLAAR